MKYKCHNCGYEWSKESGAEFENCIKCGVIFVECIKEVTNDTSQFLRKAGLGWRVL